MSLVGRLMRSIRPRKVRPLILMYHRIADVRVDPWDLAVSPERFSAQLAVLSASRQVLPMSEFVGLAKRGTLPRYAAAITFDDGYVDTLREGKPRLAAAGLPATLFLATAFIGQRVEYWWDELARSVLERTDGLDAEVVLGSEVWRLQLPSLPEPLGGSAGWRADVAPTTEREALYLALWQRLRTLTAGERDAAMTRLRDVLRTPAPAAADLPMTASEVAELAGGLFEIGGHTATHPVLPTISPAERRRELLQGKRECERYTNTRVMGFAYPHGAHDTDSRAAVAECGFAWACTTESRPLAAGDCDWFALPRMAVRDWDGAAFEQALWSASQ